MLKYKDAKAVIKVKRPKTVADVAEEAHITVDVCEFTTWRVDVIEKILNASMVRESMKPGDRVSISIEINEDATWEDDTATETK